MRVSKSHHRLAYTMLELVLVIALILIIAAMSIPVMQSMLTDARITGAGDAIRGRMADARARAMDEGRPWKLAYLSGSNLYQLAPEDSSEWNTTANDLISKADVVRDELPREVYFGLKYDDIMFGSEPMTAGSNWETAAIFLPDGTAREDVEVYFGKPGMVPMKIGLRGLTGAVNVYAVRDVKRAQP